MTSIDRLNAASPADGDQFQYGPTHLRELKTHLNTMKWDGYHVPYLVDSGAAVNGTGFFNGWFVLLEKNTTTDWNIMGVDTATGNVKAHQLTLTTLTHLSTLGEANIVNSRGVFRISSTQIGVYTDTTLYIVTYAANATTITHTHALTGAVRSICRTGIANQVAVSTTTDLQILTFAAGYAAPATLTASHTFTYANDRLVVRMGDIPGTSQTRIGVATNMNGMLVGYFTWDGVTLSAPVNVPDAAVVAPFYAYVGVMPAGESTVWVFRQSGATSWGVVYRLFEDLGVYTHERILGNFGTLCMLTDGYVLNPSDLTIQLWTVAYRFTYQDGLSPTGYY